MGEKKWAAASSERNAVLSGRYVLGKVLGRGTFAKVYVAKKVETGESVAMKVVSKEKVIRVGMTEQVKREIAVMKMVRHPNIVELHEVMATKNRIYFAMELVRGGELLSRIARAGRLREDQARAYFRQLISAVDFCHSRGVFHRDLKPENLLLDEKGDLKVADFGLSAFADHVGADGLLHTQCGTPAYVAPEVIARKGYDGAKADLWSCGVILYVLLAGFLPFQDPSMLGLYRKIFRGEYRWPSWFSPDVRLVIRRLLDPNPNRRITIAKLMETSWFKSCCDSQQQQQQKTEIPVPKEEPLDEPIQMNAFHLISLSDGLDLSPLFEDDETRDEGVKFATREPASEVVARLEGAAANAGGRFKVTKSSSSGVRIEGVERGKKGRLEVVAEIFAVAADVLVVELKKTGGDTLEYRRFWSDELRPAIKDIVWDCSDAE